jgi:hypothetical protein
MTVGIRHKGSSLNISIERSREGGLHVSTSHSMVPKLNTSDALVALPSMASGAAQPGVPTGSPWASGDEVACLELSRLMEDFGLEELLVLNMLIATPMDDAELVEDRFGNFFSKELSPKSVILAL